MLAGAFAGIAVRISNRRVRGIFAKFASGTLGHVPRRYAQGMPHPRCLRRRPGHCADMWTDEDAGHKPRARGDIHELHRQCPRDRLKGRGLPIVVEGVVQCCFGRWYIHLALIAESGARLTAKPGPAHAVYFASYEATKHALGGNEGESHEHHPLAAGAHCLHSCSPNRC